MGHANRPRLHDAFGLDAQPGRLCLSSGWSRYANTNTKRNTHGNGDAYSNNNTDTEADAHTENSADT
jgi:hypothetical protein